MCVTMRKVFVIITDFNIETLKYIDTHLLPQFFNTIQSNLLIERIQI